MALLFMDDCESKVDSHVSLAVPWASGVLARPAWAEGATQHKSVELWAQGSGCLCSKPGLLSSQLHAPKQVTPPFLLLPSFCHETSDINTNLPEQD